jgi:hypothetical protein
VRDVLAEAAVTKALSRRALGRATLARQLLLERAPIGVADAVEHLVGLQGLAVAPDAEPSDVVIAAPV